MKPPHEREGQIIGIELSRDSLTKAHVALVRVEIALRQEGRFEEADIVGYADLVILTVRGLLMRGKPLP